MNSLKATMIQAMQGMRVQSERIDLTSQNISNADTPRKTGEELGFIRRVKK